MSLFLIVYRKMVAQRWIALEIQFKLANQRAQKSTIHLCGKY